MIFSSFPQQYQPTISAQITRRLRDRPSVLSQSIQFNNHLVKRSLIDNSITGAKTLLRERATNWLQLQCSCISLLIQSSSATASASCCLRRNTPRTSSLPKYRHSLDHPQEHDVGIHGLYQSNFWPDEISFVRIGLLHTASIRVPLHLFPQINRCAGCLSGGIARNVGWRYWLSSDHRCAKVAEVWNAVALLFAGVKRAAERVVGRMQFWLHRCSSGPWLWLRHGQNSLIGKRAVPAKFSCYTVLFRSNMYYLAILL